VRGADRDLHGAAPVAPFFQLPLSMPSILMCPPVRVGVQLLFCFVMSALLRCCIRTSYEATAYIYNRLKLTACRLGSLARAMGSRGKLVDFLFDLVRFFSVGILPATTSFAQLLVAARQWPWRLFAGLPTACLCLVGASKQCCTEFDRWDFALIEIDFIFVVCRWPCLFASLRHAFK